uniref:Coagulation factor VIII n=1 Tax=Gallus gallus TaxID=9031 RepID=A0A8V0YT16_CHICK
MPLGAAPARRRSAAGAASGSPSADSSCRMSASPLGSLLPTMLLGALRCLLLLSLLGEGSGEVRRYYIGAVETAWDYVHSELLSTLQAPVGVSGPREPQPTMPGALPRYSKAVFVEYLDASFTQPKPKPAWMGLLGPTIRAEVYDTVVITFKNLASRPYNLHAVGVSYWKASEGAGYEDETSQPEQEGDRVDPGETHTYIWEIQQDQGPTDGDSQCLTHSYSSNVNSVKDTNSGLIGALLVCRPGKGTLVRDGAQNMQQDLVMLFHIGVTCIQPALGRTLWSQCRYDSWVLSFPLAGLTLCHRKQVHWHVIASGTGPEVHSIFFEGHTFLVRGHRLSSLEISPATYLTAQTMPGTAGSFRVFCQMPSHQQGNLGAQGKRNSGDWLGSKDPVMWTHYIAAEEMDWDYAPVKNTSRLFLEAGPQRIGSKYKKVMFVEYEDATFKKRKVSSQPGQGILGPVLKGEVGDQFKIVFRNLASRPYNIYPHGLTSVNPYHAMKPSQGKPRANRSALICVLAEKDVKDIPIAPGQSFTYRWSITTEDGPTQADPRCLTRFYYSSINPVQDTASGLIGPLLICFKKSMDQRGNQIMSDDMRLVLFSVFDENRSWYLEENIRRFCTDAAHVDKQDPEFYASNVMHSESINGFVFDNLQLQLCLHEVVYWYVLSVGAQSDFLSVFFSGNTFKSHAAEHGDNLNNETLSGLSMSESNITDYDDYSDTEQDFDIYGENEHDPRSFQGQIRQYFIAAMEVIWEYGNQRPQHFLKATGRRKPFRQYRKVIFREYLDGSFTQPAMRGELDEHLGILGPYIRAEIEDTIMVKFKNLASRPFSFHSSLQGYEELHGGEAVQPGEVREYSWKIAQDGHQHRIPLQHKLVLQEKDLHSGLIGPLIICRRGVLNSAFKRQLAVQEFSLLFTIFDETKSWYFPENMRRNCRPPCRIQLDNPDFRRNHSFHAINGYVGDTLPGLVMAQQQRIRWHLLNMGSTEDIHSVHFHGQMFSIRTSVFGTVEMQPSHAGIWRVECKVGEHLQAGMSALFLSSTL